jgi:isopropylmalate/homocitrate/citramalate synthase
MSEKLSICGWKTVRREAMKKVHEEIRKRESELGRELTEAEFRETVRTTLREQLRKAFEQCGA